MLIKYLIKNEVPFNFTISDARLQFYESYF